MNSTQNSTVFQLGQCWTSEGEPELGIGFVLAIDAQSVALEFPSSTQGRMYRKKNAPLRRLIFREGEKVLSKTKQGFVVAKTEVRENLVWYISDEGEELCEKDLSPKLTLTRPIERFLAGQWDTLKSYKLRAHALDQRYRALQTPARGYLGARAELLPHQLYVTSQVASRGLPRALLADEVGLGKTIEASWILHRLHTLGRVRRVLVIAPESLVNQWFVELFKRFNLSFWVPGSQTDLEVEKEDLESEERVILSLEKLSELHEKGAIPFMGWDLVIVDEAHRMTGADGEPSAEYSVIEKLAENSPGLLLLTATPEQLGIEGHFARLKLIDPHRFKSFEQFEREHADYQKIVKLSEGLTSSAKLKKADLTALKKRLEGKVPDELFENLDDEESRRALVLALNDHYGTGRIYFRNSRSVVELEGFRFPKRILKKHLIKSGEDESPSAALTKWLGEFAKSHSQQKTLLICNSAKQVSDWEKRLRDEFAIKAVAFHENLSLLARDRNAAYFEDPKGATILLCSEIGGEGRNFQQASQLILADLPGDPDVLEQRIGRLDRIGQRSDITIHVPYFKGSKEERLLKFHEEVFDGFSRPTQGGGKIYAEYAEAIESGPKKGFSDLIAEAKAAYEQQLEEIEAGRDRLIELNSLDPKQAQALVESIAASERTEELKETLDLLFDGMEIHSEDLDADTVFVEPGHSQYAAYFPSLPTEGFSFTFSRKKALARNDLTLMTWDHPLAAGTLDAIAAQEFGNISVAGGPDGILLMECAFVIEPASVGTEWFADEFFSSARVRVILDATGKDLSSTWTTEKLYESLSPLPDAAAPLVRKLPPERIRGLISKATQQAEALATKKRIEARDRMKATIEAEIDRLRALQGKNRLVSDLEVSWWMTRKEQLLQAFAGAQTRLDSFLLVVPNQLGR